MGVARRDRAAAAWAWAALTAVALLGAWLALSGGDPLPVDAWWNRAVELPTGSPAVPAAIVIANLGDGLGAAVFAVIAGAALFAARLPRDALSVLTAAALGVAMSELLKRLVLRPRPAEQLYDSSGFSYPSGHSMGAAALAVSLALVVAGMAVTDRRIAHVAWAVAVCWILVMMWSRTALHVHWLSDTVAGALLGFAAAVLARRVWVRPDRRVGGRA